MPHRTPAASDALVADADGRADLRARARPGRAAGAVRAARRATGSSMRSRRRAGSPRGGSGRHQPGAAAVRRRAARGARRRRGAAGRGSGGGLRRPHRPEHAPMSRRSTRCRASARRWPSASSTGARRTARSARSTTCWRSAASGRRRSRRCGRWWCRERRLAIGAPLARSCGCTRGARRVGGGRSAHRVLARRAPAADRRAALGRRRAGGAGARCGCARSPRSPSRSPRPRSSRPSSARRRRCGHPSGSSMPPGEWRRSSSPSPGTAVDGRMPVRAEIAGHPEAGAASVLIFLDEPAVAARRRAGVGVRRAAGGATGRRRRVPGLRRRAGHDARAAAARARGGRRIAGGARRARRGAARAPGRCCCRGWPSATRAGWSPHSTPT